MKQTIQIIDGIPAARCIHGMSPAVECLRNPFACPCAYAEGMVRPRYPVPATTENAWQARWHQWIADCYHWREEALKEG